LELVDLHLPVTVVVLKVLQSINQSGNRLVHGVFPLEQLLELLPLTLRDPIQSPDVPIKVFGLIGLLLPEVSRLSLKVVLLHSFISLSSNNGKRGTIPGLLLPEYETSVETP